MNRAESVCPECLRYVAPHFAYTCRDGVNWHWFCAMPRPERRRP